MCIEKNNILKGTQRVPMCIEKNNILKGTQRVPKFIAKEGYIERNPAGSKVYNKRRIH